MHLLIKDSQHGFTKRKSCLTNLLVLMEEMSNYVDSGYPVDVIYLVFQKAFNKVPHKQLKLAAHGIGGKVLKWLENWLQGRMQRVVLGGHMSQWQDILSTQGSVFGLLQFVIYIDDTGEAVNSRILYFADDTKIYLVITSADEIDGLCVDLSNLVSWSKDWQMLFNTGACKCKIMHLGYNNTKAGYFMDSVQLETLTDEWDLVVIVSDDLKREKQCVAAVKV